MWGGKKTVKKCNYCNDELNKAIKGGWRCGAGEAGVPLMSAVRRREERGRARRHCGRLGGSGCPRRSAGSERRDEENQHPAGQPADGAPRLHNIDTHIEQSTPTRSRSWDGEALTATSQTTPCLYTVHVYIHRQFVYIYIHIVSRRLQPTTSQHHHCLSCTHLEPNLSIFGPSVGGATAPGGLGNRTHNLLASCGNA